MSEINSWTDAARQTLERKPVPPAGGGEAVQKAMIVAPADFPIDPHRLCGVAPGTFYVIRTAGGLVPPSSGTGTDQGIAAALEYAVRIAAVEHVILITHPDCGMLRCLLDEEAPRAGYMLEGDFLPAWTRLIAPALARAGRADISLAERQRFCAQEMIRVSIEHLMTYSWILDAAYNGRLGLHGWYCDPSCGTLACFDPENDRFA